MGLRDIEATLPPGFRFHPNDEELVCHYLYKKIANEGFSTSTMIDVDLHTCEPWHLPDVAKLGANEWYFFSFRDRKYATGSRTNRATTSGYWKATGKDRAVLDTTSHAIIGMRKTLVFYRGRAPHGIKTDWIMHEFRLEGPHVPPKEDWVLCRVFHKSTRETSLKSGINQHENNMSWLSSCHVEESRTHLIPSSSITHLETHNFPKTLLNPGKLHYNCLEDAETSNLIEFNYRQEDEFSFLLDV